MSARPVLGVVFDKDGTLLDFHKTWDRAFGLMLEHFAAGSDEMFAALCGEMGFDPRRGMITDDSPFVYDSNDAFAQRLALVLGRPANEFNALQAIEDCLNHLSPLTPTPADGAAELLTALAERDVPMAIATNDSHFRARDQIRTLGWESHFCAILGYDSGHPEKPHPAMVLAAAESMGLRGDQVAMVGDSATDVGSGRDAGSFVVLVGSRRDLAPQADVVLADIGELTAHI